jgi:hypothetical protein
MKLSLHSVPWLLAVTGLAIPLVATGFVIWPLVAVWLAILALIWSIGRAGLVPDRTSRVALAIGLLPVLFLLAFEGGWWLIPADLAWLVIELANRGGATGRPTSPNARGYWTASLALIAFGIAGAMSIGLPFLLIGLAMLVLSPIRHRPLAFWPAFLGFVAFNVAELLIVPAYCSATSTPGGVETQTTCSSLTGIPWPADAAGAGASGGAFVVASGVAVFIGIAVFVLALAWLYVERTKRQGSDGGVAA